eukprot:7264373-Pyramimonas_sp.AAC.1
MHGCRRAIAAMREGRWRLISRAGVVALAFPLRGEVDSDVRRARGRLPSPSMARRRTHALDGAGSPPASRAELSTVAPAS